MKAKLKLNTKLIIIGIFVTVTPLLLVIGIIYRGNLKMTQISEKSATELSYNDLDHIIENVYGMCANQAEFLQQHIDRCLSAASEILSKSEVNFESSDLISWDAVNQFTKISEKIEIPKVLVKNEWIGQNKDTNKESPVVDEVFRMTGATCTIFQKINQKGDMLRICTNVQTSDAKRAIGTYIPSTNPDGKANPVLTDILNGKKYSGRACYHSFRSR